MIGIDTNVLLRYLYRKDDPAQGALATRLIAEAHAPSQTECGRGLFVIEAAGTVREAVDEYAAGPADFADYLVGRIAHRAGAATTYTLDREAATAATFKHLERA